MDVKNLPNAKFDEIIAEFYDSSKFDQHLFQADIQVIVAYCDALFNAGILTRQESERIKNGLQSIIKRVEYDKNYFGELASENIHSFIIARLVQLIGDAGKKLHIGWNETEHTITTLRFWLRGEIEEISQFIKEIQKILIEISERQKEAVLPIYINFQKKKPVLWGHWCLAYFEKFERGRERLEEVWRRVNVSPFGAETSFEIDREEIAAALGFEGVTMNGLDTISDRDFVLEFIVSCSFLMSHLARLAEDLILYNSKELNFIELKAEINKASNLTTQEKNIELLEKIRGKSVRIFGHQVTLFSVLKDSPSAFNKNMQEEKLAIFDTAETVKKSIKAICLILSKLRVNEQITLRTAMKDNLSAPELIDYLLKKDVPFDVAHETVEKIVHYAVSKNSEINELNLTELQNFSLNIDKDVFQVLSLEHFLASRNQIGGTAPERVFEALLAAKEGLDREER